MGKSMAIGDGLCRRSLEGFSRVYSVIPEGEQAISRPVAASLRNHGFERSTEPIARSVAFTLSGRTKCLSPDCNTADEPLSALPEPTRSRIPSNVPSCCRLPGCGCTYMTRWNTCQVTLSCRSTGPMTIASGNRFVVSAAVQPITVSHHRLLSAPVMSSEWVGQIERIDDSEIEQTKSQEAVFTSESPIVP
jgi:hypothetical protein